MLSGVISQVIFSWLPINDKLVLLDSAPNLLELHVSITLDILCFIHTLEIPTAVELSTRIKVGGCR